MFCCEWITRDLHHYCTNACFVFNQWYSLSHMDLYDCLRLKTHVQTVAKNVTPREHNSLFFSSPESTCGVQMCVHCQSDGYKSASHSEQASRGSRCSYVGLFFPWELHRSCNQGCVLYWTGKHAARSSSGPKQHTTSIRSVPPTVCGSARLESWKAACFLASVGFS